MRSLVGPPRTERDFATKSAAKLIAAKCPKDDPGGRSNRSSQGRHSMSHQHPGRTPASMAASVWVVIAGSCLGLGCQSSKGIAREVSLVPPRVVRQASAEKPKTKATPASRSILKISK
jgi:hypothetical protein